MESNFKKTVDSLFNGMENFVSSKTVIGEPIHVDGTIILPLVDVSFGVGAGASESKKENSLNGAGGGGGLAAKISPSAILVIQNGHTKLVNIKNQDSLTKIIDLVPDLMDRFAIAQENKKAAKAKDKEEEA